MFIDAFQGLNRRDSLPAAFTGLTGNALANLLFGMQDVPLPTKSNKIVNAESALGLSTVFRCVTLMAEKYAQVPIQLKQTQKDGSEKLITDHWAAVALGRVPNYEMDLFTFKKVMIFLKLLRGQMFCSKDVSADGSTGYLWPLISPTMQAVRLWTSTTSPDLIYRYSYNVYQEHTPNGALASKDFQPDQLLIMPDVTMNGITGISRISLAREGIALGLCYEEYSARLMANDAVPRGFIVSKGALKKETKQQMREEWANAMTGMNRHKIGILDAEVDFKSTGLSNQNIEFLSSREFQIQEVCRWFGVPPHMVGDLSRSTNNNIEQQSLDFLVNCMDPLMVSQESAYNRCLLSEDELAAGYHFVHDREALIAADLEAVANASQKDLMNGVKTFNEVRKARGLNPVKGGDILMFNLGYGPLGNGYMTTNEIRKKADLKQIEGADVIMGLKSQQPETADAADPQDKNNPMGGNPQQPQPGTKPPAGAPPTPPPQNAQGANQPPAKEGLKRAFLPVFEDVFTRVARKETKKIDAILKKRFTFGGGASGSTLAMREGFEPAYARSLLDPAVNAVAALTGIPAERCSEFLDEMEQRHAARDPWTDEDFALRQARQQAEKELDNLLEMIEDATP